MSHLVQCINRPVVRSIVKWLREACLEICWTALLFSSATHDRNFIGWQIFLCVIFSNSNYYQIFADAKLNGFSRFCTENLSYRLCRTFFAIWNACLSSSSCIKTITLELRVISSTVVFPSNRASSNVKYRQKKLIITLSSQCLVCFNKSRFSPLATLDVIFLVFFFSHATNFKVSFSFRLSWTSEAGNERWDYAVRRNGSGKYLSFYIFNM